MIIRYYGHSFFTFKFSNGITIAIDPYDESVGYPLPDIVADIVICSHEHHDHNNSDIIKGNPKVLNLNSLKETKSKAIYNNNNIKILAFSDYHDAKSGSLRGKNMITVIKADGLTLVHMGDTGRNLPFARQLALYDVDILMVPVGGYYTIDARQALTIVNKLKPKITIPMHYKTEPCMIKEIVSIDAFTNLLDKKPDTAAFLRITKQDISERDHIILLSHTGEIDDIL